MECVWPVISVRASAVILNQRSSFISITMEISVFKSTVSTFHNVNSCQLQLICKDGGMDTF